MVEAPIRPSTCLRCTLPRRASPPTPCRRIACPAPQPSGPGCDSPLPQCPCHPPTIIRRVGEVGHPKKGRACALGKSCSVSLPCLVHAPLAKPPKHGPRMVETVHQRIKDRGRKWLHAMPISVTKIMAISTMWMASQRTAFQQKNVENVIGGAGLLSAMCSGSSPGQAAKNPDVPACPHPLLSCENCPGLHGPRSPILALQSTEAVPVWSTHSPPTCRLQAGGSRPQIWCLS